MKVVALIADIEVADYNSDNELTSRTMKKVFALEAEIPIEFRKWLLDRPPVQVKEG